MPQAVFVPAQLNDLALDVALSGVAQGDILYRGATKFNNRAAGTSGQFLKTQGVGADPVWSGLAASDLAPAVILAPATSARNRITTIDVAVVPLSVQSPAGMAANHFEWRDNSSNVLGQINSIGGISIGTTQVTALLEMQPAAGNDAMRVHDQNGDMRYESVGNGNTFWFGVPATAVLTSNISPTMGFVSTRWTGSASANETMSIRTSRIDSGANRSFLAIKDNGNADCLTVAGTGGQVYIGGTAASAAAIARGQLVVTSVVTSTPNLGIRGIASQSGEFIKAQNSTPVDCFTVAVSALTTITLTDATTSTISDALVLDHRTSGTAAAGFGQQLRFKAQSSTTGSRNVGLLSSAWVVATDASRTGRMRAWASDATADRECIRWETDGTNAMVGFLGAAASARVAITGSRAGNAALASLLTELAAKGLITDSTTA